MNRENFNKLWESSKIDDKIFKLIEKRNAKMEEIKKLNEQINDLKDLQRKYE